MESTKYVRPYHFYVENFRNFRDVSLELGRKLTVISGQNGVGKSNLLSLIASSSGVSKKSTLGSNFQPEFNEFFNIDEAEEYDEYKLYLQYQEGDGSFALVKRLSFKNDIDEGRGIRVIPRTSNYMIDNCTLKQAENDAKSKYGVGGAGRVKIPTIYLSLSRLYPLGERKESVSITRVYKTSQLYQKKTDEKFKEWYNIVVPNTIEKEATLSLVKKNACPRASLHMDIVNTPTLSQSIGQDNVGNIISALVDIYVLSLEDDYKGALLCIDEIDVSLHPDTQIRLLDLFDQLAEELKIQFVVSTHSLTVIKETIKKEKKNPIDFSVVYIKNPQAPFVTQNSTYEILKSDMFGSLSFNKPKVRVYFEDFVGKELFRLLMGAYRTVYKLVENATEEPKLRNSGEVKNYREINDRIIQLVDLITIEDNLNQIATVLGCECLLQISEADLYFNRVIFVLDGDARYKEPSQKPKIRDYLDKKYNQKELKLNDRKHKKNICFFPDYFAPESFLYSVIKRISDNPLQNSSFWRSLDQKEETALYTSDKLKNMFSTLEEEFDNDCLKKIFKDVSKSEIWDFIEKSDIISYYYSDYQIVDELLSFMESIKEAYGMTKPITLSNRYI